MIILPARRLEALYGLDGSLKAAMRLVKFEIYSRKLS